MVQSRASVGSIAAAAPEQARALLEATASTSAPALPQAPSGAAAARAHSGLPVLAARVSTASRERMSSVTLQSLVSASNDVLGQVRGAPAQSATDVPHAKRSARYHCLCCNSTDTGAAPRACRCRARRGLGTLARPHATLPGPRTRAAARACWGWLEGAGPLPNVLLRGAGAALGCGVQYLRGFWVF